MSPSTDLPPPGPERDRLVAEALGCTTWAMEDDMDHPAGCFCALDDPPHEVALRCSDHNHGALETLEAWKRGGKGRRVRIEMADDWYMGEHYAVTLWTNGRPVLGDITPTLGDAASRAIIEAKRREG